MIEPTVERGFDSLVSLSELTDGSTNILLYDTILELFVARKDNLDEGEIQKLLDTINDLLDGNVLTTTTPNIPTTTEESLPFTNDVFVHYKPWFETPEYQGFWGWHWKMNSMNPENILSNGQREIASHYYPLIGPYASNDPDVLEYHFNLMEARVYGVSSKMSQMLKPRPSGS